MADLKTPEEKFSYAIGLSFASQLLGSGIKEINTNLVAEAMADVMGGKNPQISPEEANEVIQKVLQEKADEQNKVAIEAGKAYLEENATKEGVSVMESGIQYEILAEGNGEKPTIDDQVKCHYHGTLIDGTVFDSSVQRNEPATFPLNGVIKGWQIALQEMPVGSKWRLTIPSDLAYGAQGAGQMIGPHTTLVFEVELLEIVK